MVVRRPKSRKASATGLLLLLLPGAALFLPTTILIAVGMLPAFVAWVVDRDPRKTAPITVGVLNFCGVLPFLIMLWRDGHTMNQAAILLTRPTTWIIMYAAAGVGWIFYTAAPQVIASAVIMKNQARAASLEKQRQELLKAWGPAVAEKPPDPRSQRPGRDG
jgi:uncharacterized membrane protein